MDINWKTIVVEIQNIINLARFKLDKEDIDYVQHYLDHDEYEIAFEILFLCLMKFDKLPLIDYDKVIELGKQLKLDEESVYDLDFWSNFIEYVSKENNVEK